MAGFSPTRPSPSMSLPALSRLQARPACFPAGHAPTPSGKSRTRTHALRGRRALKQGKEVQLSRPPPPWRPGTATSRRHSGRWRTHWHASRQPTAKSPRRWAGATTSAPSPSFSLLLSSIAPGAVRAAVGLQSAATGARAPA
jgi:hypothetical protein